MSRHQGFTLQEIVFATATTMAGICLVLPALTSEGGPRRTTRSMQNSTQVRGIHTGLVLFAQGNNSQYVGIMKDGKTVDPAIGLTVENRIQALIDLNYFTMEYARSPSEAQTGTTSYALLQVPRTNDQSQVRETGRLLEWKDTTNTHAVVISDRAVDNGGAFTHIRSIHTSPSRHSTQWTGSVGWNDNHVTFEKSMRLPTKYDEQPAQAEDRLFFPNGPHDAFMVHQGSDRL